MRLARICAKRTSSALYSRSDQALIRVRAPRLRSRARIGVTIDERSPSERRKWRSSGEVAIRRSSSSRTFGHHWGMWRQLRSNLTSHWGGAGSLVRNRSSISASSPRPRTRVAIRDTRPSWIASTMQMSASCRHDHLGHPLQRLGQRQRAVGDRADRVEQPQALRAAGRALSHPGAGDREAGPQHDQRNPHRELGLVDTRVPARARNRSAEGEQPDRRGRARAGEQRGDERGRDIGADDRRGLPGRAQRRRRPRAPASRSRRPTPSQRPAGCSPALRPRNLPIKRRIPPHPFRWPLGPKT